VEKLLQWNPLHLFELCFLPCLDMFNQLNVPICRDISAFPLKIEPTERSVLLKRLIILISWQMNVFLNVNDVVPATVKLIFEVLEQLLNALILISDS
jgi:hypothetical protein